mmetsp:Transcript_44444/g.172613  ORF Transcript_44444/g.172613 Transcript_44444/m.172613 type:complete len:88 (+) Transcript_44444:688-951(+)
MYHLRHAAVVRLATASAASVGFSRPFFLLIIGLILIPTDESPKDNRVGIVLLERNEKFKILYAAFSPAHKVKQQSSISSLPSSCGRD